MSLSCSWRVGKETKGRGIVVEEGGGFLFFFFFFLASRVVAWYLVSALLISYQFHNATSFFAIFVSLALRFIFTRGFIG